jgi:GNAT superfamily N-acetyltransferase
MATAASRGDSVNERTIDESTRENGRARWTAPLGRAKAYLKMGIATLRYEGALPLPLRVTRLACRPFGTLLTVSFCRKDLTAPVVAPEAKAQVDIARLTAADAGALAVIVANRTVLGPADAPDVALAERRIRQKLELGGVCFVATHAGAIIHYNWVYPGVHWQVWGPIRFEPVAPTDALCDDAYTLEEWRGNGIHGAVHARMLQYLQHTGYTTSYTLLSTDNRASRKALTALGYSFDDRVILFQARRSGQTRQIRFGSEIPQFQAGTS